MPKSRGRRKNSGGKKPARRSPVPLSHAERLLHDARKIATLDDPLMAEIWASGRLGQAWRAAGLNNRQAAHQLCTEVCARACIKPSPQGMAAVAALARVAPATETELLTKTIDMLGETQPLPAWHTAGGWSAVAAWRAADVWESERVLLIDYDGPHPHTLMARITNAGGLWVDKLAVLEPGVARRWDELHDDDDVPMPISDRPVADVLADLADALRTTDMTVPRNEDEDFVEFRALAWSRCREHLPDWSVEDRLPDSERHRLTEDFTTSSGLDDEVTRSLVDLFLDYGEGYIGAGPLYWSPDEVALLLTDWLPRKAVLDADQRTALPAALRQWLTFALTQRGVDSRWIAPVVEAVDTHLPEFREAFDDPAAAGPAKQIAAALADRGVDLNDPQAVDAAIRELNAERLARQLTE